MTTYKKQNFIVWQYVFKLFYSFIKSKLKYSYILNNKGKSPILTPLILLLLSVLFSINLFAATGDSFNTAQQVDVNATINGTLQYQWNRGNYYYYKFTAPADGEVHIYSAGLSSNTDADLYNNNYNWLTGDSRNNYNIDITQAVSVGKTYYISLYNYDINNQDNFTLHIDFSIPKSYGSFRDFSKRVKFFAAGNMVTIGNTFTVAPQNYNSSTCDSYTNGAFVDPVSTNNANQYFCQYNVDGKQGSAATTAQLIIPPGSTIKWAGLYWQALTPHRTSSYNTMTIDIRRDENGTTYTQVPVTHVDYQSKYSYNIYPVGSSAGATSADIYSAFANVTDIFKNKRWLSGHYTVRTSDVMEGREKYFGVYGGWNLIVIYENPNESYKSFTVFDGWKQVSSNRDENNVPITVSGFYTPKQKPIKAKISIFAGEGDYNIGGDKLLALRKSDNTLIPLVNSHNPNSPNQTFSSYIHTTGSRTPSEYNNNGIDIQEFNVGSNTTYNLLQTQQSDLTFHFTSTGDLYFPSVLAFTTDIYKPNICYDYTYGQNGHFITAPSIKPPLLDGTFDKSKPIDIKLYFKNLENSDITIKNLTLDVDLNTSIAKYKPGTVYVTPSNQNRQHILDSDLNVSSTGNYVNNIPIGDVGSLDYFYAYYSLIDTNQTKINNMPINVTLRYTLHINGILNDIESFPTKIQDMNPCQSNSSYNPVLGRFNVVQDGETKSSDPYYYFNLPTQVVSRVGNFKVESMDPNNLNKSKTGVKDQNVTVEMINVAGFHYTTASCTDQNATVISKNSVLATFDNNNTYTTDLNKTAMKNAGFFNKAVKNAAFRLGYYKDGNTSAGRIKVCSRDNFAIRPDSFSIALNDQNQSNTSSIRFIDGNNYTTPSITRRVSKIAAGYQYKLEINATNFLGNNATLGYSKSFLSTDNDNNISLIWIDNPPLTCNDDNNYSKNFSFYNGHAEGNFSLSQVGKYHLHIIDTTWTDVDHNPAFMTHHVEPYFHNGPDCNISSSNVQAEDNNTTLNGCLISSDHNNTFYSLYYKDLYVFFEPYKFVIPNFTSNGFKYMANIENNSSNIMAVHYNGKIKVLGKDNSILSNYVNGCYANDINISFQGNIDLNDSIPFKIRFIDYNSSKIPQADFTRDINNSINNNFDDLNLSKIFFRKDDNGTMDINISMNYDRNKTIATNPQIVEFDRVNVNCSPISDCQIKADLKNDFNITGTDDFSDRNITFFYGRVHAPDYSSSSNTINNAKIYYEVYCKDKDCNKSKYPSLGAESVDDIYWYINKDHNSSNSGQIFGYPLKSITPTNLINITSVGNIASGVENKTIKYNGNQYPYKERIDINTSSWLIYNPYDPNAKYNYFYVKFSNIGGWAGIGKTGKTVDLNISTKSSKRIEW